MRTIVIISLIGILSMGFINQSTGQNISTQQKSRIEKQVDSIFHCMLKAAENLDYDILNQGVDDKYSAGFITNGAYFMRFDSLLNILKTRSQGITKQSITIQKEKITVLSENIVLLTAYGDTKVDVNFGNSFTAKFYWSFVYEKIVGNWKVIQSHQSSIR